MNFFNVGRQRIVSVYARNDAIITVQRGALPLAKGTGR